MVLTVKSPGVKSTLQKKRQAHIDKLYEYESSFRKLGMKDMPLEILGFMPQDNINEDMRYLVDVNGNKLDTIYDLLEDVSNHLDSLNK